MLGDLGARSDGKVNDFVEVVEVASLFVLAGLLLVGADVGCLGNHEVHLEVVQVAAVAAV